MSNPTLDETPTEMLPSSPSKEGTENTESLTPSLPKTTDTVDTDEVDTAQVNTDEVSANEVATDQATTAAATAAKEDSPQIEDSATTPVIPPVAPPTRQPAISPQPGRIRLGLLTWGIVAIIMGAIAIAIGFGAQINLWIATIVLFGGAGIALLLASLAALLRKDG